MERVGNADIQHLYLRMGIEHSIQILVERYRIGIDSQLFLGLYIA